jgi:hypothetical protein
VAPVLLLLVAIPAFAQKSSSSRPPRELHRVGDHWTAYNPPDPSTYPANAKTHVIAAGDTLWALAERYYGNAYLWPQVWESNTWITDAHWIYPGDVLLLEGEAGQTAGAETAGSGTASGETILSGGVAVQEVADSDGTGTVAPRVVERRPIPLGTESDIYCFGYIGDPNEPMPNVFESIEDAEVTYTPQLKTDKGASVAEGELIYIKGGTATGLVAGETYIAVEAGPLIRHPRTKEVIGRHYLYNGQIRILCAEENQSRAIVSQSCRPIHIGARLKPVPQLPIPIARIPDIPAFCDPPTGSKVGYIVYALDWNQMLGEGNLVQINLGSDQIQPGDFLTVYRESPRPGQPPQVLGEIGILTTDQATSTGKIVAMRRTMAIGDRVEMR